MLCWWPDVFGVVFGTDFDMASRLSVAFTSLSWLINSQHNKSASILLGSQHWLCPRCGWAPTAVIDQYLPPAPELGSKPAARRCCSLTDRLDRQPDRRRTVTQTLTATSVCCLHTAQRATRRWLLVESAYWCCSSSSASSTSSTGKYSNDVEFRKHTWASTEPGSASESARLTNL